MPDAEGARPTTDGLERCFLSKLYVAEIGSASSGLKGQKTQAESARLEGRGRDVNHAVNLV